MKIRYTLQKLIIAALLLVSTTMSYAQMGAIAGKVVDKASGEELIGASLLLEGTSHGTTTDMEGRYSIKLAPGTYNLICTYVSYQKQTITGIVVKENATTQLDLLLENESIALSEVVVSATMLKDTDASLLSMQKKAFAVQDGISAQQIGRTGTTNAAESMKQISGASVEDGKYLVMRGLGDRYSMTQLNGLNMASSDPYRNSSSMDLIPSSIIDNIITSKTFTPDQPGSFAGGNLNVSTKAFPDKFNVSLSAVTSYNTQSSLNRNFNTHTGGQYDWLGFDDGTRALPDYLKTEEARQHLSQISYLYARNPSSEYDELRNIMHRSARDLSLQFVPVQKRAPLNTGLNFSVGNTRQLFGRDFGYTVGANFNKNFTHYENGILTTYINTTNPTLFTYQDLRENRSIESTQAGAFANVSYKLHQNHTLGSTVIFSNDADKGATQQSGSWIGQISNSEATYHTNVIEYTQRQLRSLQLNGKHILPSLFNATVDWSGGVNKNTHIDPLSYFAYISFPQEAEKYDEDGNYLGSTTETAYNINNAEFAPPFHFFRKLTDNQQQFKVDVTIPVTANKQNQVKIGGYYNNTDRDFEEYRFQLNNTQVPANIRFPNFNGDFNALFSPQNFGIVDTLMNGDGQVSRYVPGYYYINQVNNKNFYTGRQTIPAAYAMGIFNLTPKIKVVGGIRVEGTQVFTQSRDESVANGNINEWDILPSLNVVYALSPKSNLRVAASQTLARPNLREISPFVRFDNRRGFFEVGNPDLNRTLIQNYDLRWEVYPKPEDMIAVSAYYKRFTDPIVYAYIPQATIPEFTWINIDKAEVAGVEFEFRKGLGFIAPVMNNFFVSSNFTLIHSSAPINPGELQASQTVDPSYNQTTRPFQGQSPYIINAMLTYQSAQAGLESTLSFNMAGRRLYQIAMAATPDVYEESVPMLNYKITKDLGRYFQASFTARNLLNAEIRKTQYFNNQTYVAEGFKIGTSFQVGVSYRIR